MVDHLPSTMNLYSTLSSHGTQTVATKPVGPLFKRIERAHYWKNVSACRARRARERIFERRTLSKVPVTKTSLALYGLERGEEVSQQVGEREASKED